MVDDGGFEIELRWRSSRRSARRQRGERSHELSAAELTLLEAGHKIGNERLHVTLLWWTFSILTECKHGAEDRPGDTGCGQPAAEHHERYHVRIATLKTHPRPLM